MVTGSDLHRVADIVEQERSNYTTRVPPDEPYALDVIPNDPRRDPWLLSEPYPADRLLGGVS